MHEGINMGIMTALKKPTLESARGEGVEGPGQRGENRELNGPARLVPTLVGGKVRWGRNNGESSSNPSWFFAVVSLALAHSLHGYEGQRHRKRGALAWRALDVDGPMVGHNDFAHDIEAQACPFRTCTI